MGEKGTGTGGRGWIWVSLVAMVLGSGLFVFYQLLRVPYDVAKGGAEVVEKTLDRVEDVARAFRQGSITTTFLSYATELQGTTRLQVATLNQQEIFERRDEATTFWGTVDLPDVVVRATAPVEYTYYLDLEREWVFELQGHILQVTTPRLRYNKPAVDVTLMEFEVAGESVFRDSEIVRENLRREITPMVHRRGRENIPLVREVARRQTERFVRRWLAAQFGDGSGYSVEVTFRDELGSEPPITLPSGREELPPASPGSSASAPSGEPPG